MEKVAPTKLFDVVDTDVEVLLYKHEVTQVQHTSENGAVPGPSVLFLWTLVTSGLYSFFGHKELVLTVKRKVLEEVLPEGIQDFFQAIVHTITNEGNSFDEGAWVSLEGTTPLFGKFPSVAFGPVDFGMYRGLEGELSSKSTPTALCMPITRTEFELCEQSCATRVLALLGSHHQRYPFPPWCDTERVSVVTASDVQAAKDSALVKATRVLVGDTWATLNTAQKVVQLRVSSTFVSKLERVFDELDLDAALALMLTFDEEADGHLLWRAGNAREMTPWFRKNAEAPTTLSASYVMFLPEQAKDLVIANEDGFLVMITTPNWGTLRQALKLGMSCAVRSDAPGGLELKFDFIDDFDDEQ